jgi:hypothetical protein
MDSGWGIDQITDESDLEAIKQPYMDLLAKARGTPEAGRLFRVSTQPGAWRRKAS